MKQNYLFGAMLLTACVFSANVKADMIVDYQGNVKIDKNLTVLGTLNYSKLVTDIQSSNLTVTGTFKTAKAQIDTCYVTSKLSVGTTGRTDAKLTINGSGTRKQFVNYGVYSSLNFGTGAGNLTAVYGTCAGLGSQLIGVQGSATGNSMRPAAPAIGVYGIATGNSQGRNYGVYGALQDGSENGAGVYGSTSTTIQAVPGRYAGYFNGQTKVNGHIYADNISESSDARLKTNITGINKGAMAKIKDLRAVQYNWSKDANKDHKHLSENTDFNRKHYGFIAQEVQKIYPELVYTDDEGYLSINYTELIPFLIQAVQELSTEVEQLKKANK